MASGLSTFVVMYFLNNQFYGLIVGKLPFVPFSFVSSMSHRGIDGEDYSQVSLLFIFILC